MWWALVQKKNDSLRILPSVEMTQKSKQLQRKVEYTEAKWTVQPSVKIRAEYSQASAG